MLKKEYLTIPNILSTSRIVFLPALFVLISYKRFLFFTIAYAVLGMTDMIDGMIARKFNQKTEIGKYLDAAADLIFCLSSAYFVRVLYKDYLSPNKALFYTLMVILVLFFMVSFICCKKIIPLHTFLVKCCAVMVYVLVILSYFFDTTNLIAFILCGYIVAFLEHILIIIKFKNIDPDTFSIFSLIKKSKMKSQGEKEKGELSC